LYRILFKYQLNCYLIMKSIDEAVTTGRQREKNIFKQLYDYYTASDLYSYDPENGEKVKITQEREHPLNKWLKITAADLKNNFFQLGKPYPRLTTQLIRSGLALAVMNFSCYPPIESARLTAKSEDIGQIFNDYVTFNGMRDQVRAGYTARDFLEASSQIVFDGLNEKDENACELYPIVVNDMYRRLVRSSSRDYLLGYTRVVAGPPIFKDRLGHMWLQLKENGEWVNFEASLNVARLNQDSLFAESIKDLSERIKLTRGESSHEFDEVHFTSSDGKLFLPTAKSWLYGGGFAGYAWTALTKKI